jgi:glycosyltransferase involved in cell wall biosynthesis
MKLSVIIPCHNAENTLGLQLQALAAQKWDESWECIVADNRSTDGSREVAERFYGLVPGLKVVDALEKTGAAYARNVAVMHACGESLAFCDADDLVDDGWVAAMGKALENHDLVACRVETSKLNPPWLRGHEQETGLQMIWYPPWLPHAGGGTIGCKRRLFEVLGGFDESMIFLEDTQFCFQAQFLGVEMGYVSEAVVHMRRRANLLGHYRQSRNYAEYNVILAKQYQSANEPARCRNQFVSRRNPSNPRKSEDSCVLCEQQTERTTTIQPQESQRVSHWQCHKQFMRDWLQLIRLARSMRTTNDRFSWAWMLGRQVGRIKGMLRCGGMPV